MIGPECIDWYRQLITDRWRADARAQLAEKMLAEPEYAEGFQMASDQLDDLPVPVDVNSFIASCNARITEWVR